MLLPSPCPCSTIPAAPPPPPPNPARACKQQLPSLSLPLHRRASRKGCSGVPSWWTAEDDRQLLLGTHELGWGGKRSLEHILADER